MKANKKSKWHLFDFSETIKFNYKQIFLFSLLILFRNEGWADNSGRALLVISELDHRGVKELAPLYRKIEQLSWAIPAQSKRLDKIYKFKYLLKDDKATGEGVKESIINILSDPRVTALDVILGVHGRPEKLSFYDGSVLVKSWTDDLKLRMMQNLENLDKLGFLYNLSCYGSTHINSFLDLGFKVVVGSRKVNANAEMEYPWVIKALGYGRTVADSFEKPNSDSWLDLADGPLRWIGQKNGNFLQETDSYKFIGGQKDYQITESLLAP